MRVETASHPQFKSSQACEREESIENAEPIIIKYKLYRIMAELASIFAEINTQNRSLTHATGKRILATNEGEVDTLRNHAFTKTFFALVSGVAGAGSGFASEEYKNFFKVCTDISSGLGSASDPLFNCWTSEVRALESHMKEIDLSGSKEATSEANQSLEKLFNMWMTIQRNANHKG